MSSSKGKGKAKAVDPFADPKPAEPVPPRTLDELVASHAARHDALRGELAAISSAADLRAVSEARSAQLQQDLMWANHDVVKAKRTATNVTDKVKKVKEVNKITKIFAAKKIRAREQDAAKEAEDSHSYVTALEIHVQDIKIQLNEELEKVQDFTQLAVRRSQVLSELDALYEAVFSGENTIPCDRQATATALINEANDKSKGKSMRDDPSLLLSLLKQSQRVMGPVPISELAQLDSVFVEALKHNKGKQPALTVQMTNATGTSTATAMLHEHDLSFLRTEKDIRDYLRIINLDSDRVVKEAEAAKAVLREQLHELFDNIRISNLDSHHLDEEGPVASSSTRPIMPALPIAPIVAVESSS